MREHWGTIFFIRVFANHPLKDIDEDMEKRLIQLIQDPKFLTDQDYTLVVSDIRLPKDQLERPLLSLVGISPQIRERRLEEVYDQLRHNAEFALTAKTIFSISNRETLKKVIEILEEIGINYYY